MFFYIKDMGLCQLLKTQYGIYCTCANLQAIYVHVQTLTVPSALSFQVLNKNMLNFLSIMA